MGRRLPVILFALDVFVGAFLLFQVQPLVGKYILPWFGGSPAVWTVCMLFFQVMLLIGYAYAHASATCLTPPMQAGVHIVLLAAAVLLLPIVPGDRWIPTDANDPTLRILGMLLASVGVPFVALSATGPLVQAWFARVVPGRSPYRLYALSNAASLIALLSFPVLVEPNLTRAMQARLWGYLLVGFAVLCSAGAILAARYPRVWVAESVTAADRRNDRSSTAALWIALATCASALLLAVTNKICQDVAVVPLLWVVPLSIYLLSFIVCFDRPAWYRRSLFLPLTGLSMAGVCWMMLRQDVEPPIVVQISVYCVALLMCCMLCHGELYAARPGHDRLTSFYLAIAFGGALGGAMVAIAAPLLLSGYFELHIALFGCAVLALVVVHRDSPGRRSSGLVASAVAVLAVALLLNVTSFMRDSTMIARKRNFHGVLRVYDVLVERPFEHHRILQHAGVAHGLQFPSRPNLPTAYYGPTSGAGIALRYAPRPHALRVGVVGLGVGTVVLYGQKGDTFRAYEINPDVVSMAHQHFSFLRQAAGDVQIVLGDARMSLARESDQQFDLIVLDAFSGDSIPVHLLTRECFELYLRHLRVGGTIAVHISNQHLELAPVITRLAEHFGLGWVHITSNARPDMGQYKSRWMLLSTDRAWLESEPVRSASGPIQVRRHIRLWTDDDTNLFQIIN
jgi:hypothetical protein